MSGAPLSCERYALSIFQRERTLDQYRIRIRQLHRGWLNQRVDTLIEGDLKNAWSSLEAHAHNYCVPFVPGDWDRSNRVPELEQRLAREPSARAEFRTAYAAAIMRYLMQSSALQPLSAAAQRKVADFAGDEVYMNNPFLPLVQRIPGLIERLDLQRVEVMRQAAIQASATRSDPDPVLFPGQPIERLSDWVKLQRDLRGGDLASALSRARLDMTTYIQIMMKFGQMIAVDPALQARYGALLCGARVSAN